MSESLTQSQQDIVAQDNVRKANTMMERIKAMQANARDRGKTLKSSDAANTFQAKRNQQLHDDNEMAAVFPSAQRTVEIDEQPAFLQVANAPRSEIPTANAEPVDLDDQAAFENLEEQLPLEQNTINQYQELQNKIAEYEAREQSMRERQAKIESDLIAASRQNEELALREEQRRQQMEANRPVTQEDIKEFFSEDEIETIGIDRCIADIKRHRKMAIQTNKKFMDQLALEQQKFKRDIASQQVTVFESSLTSKVPDWREIDSNANFIKWLDQVNPVYGMTPRETFSPAFKSLDAGRASALYLTYKAQTARKAPTPRRMLPSSTGGVAEVETQIQGQRPLTVQEIKAFTQRMNNPNTRPSLKEISDFNQRMSSKLKNFKGQIESGGRI